MRGARRALTVASRSANRTRAGAACAVLVGLLLAGCTEQVAGNGSVAADAHLPTPSPTPTPVATTNPAAELPGADCPQKDVDTSATALDRAILPSTPTAGLRLDPHQSGPITKSQLITLPSIIQIAGSRQFIESVGYVNGYQNGWLRGNLGQPRSRAEYATLYEFSSTEGACAFAAWETTHFTMTPVPGRSDSGLVSSVLLDGPGPSPKVATYLAPKGRFIVMTGVVLFDTKSDGLATFSLQRFDDQYKRI